MESVGALGSSTGASSNLLSLPAPFPWDEDEESLGLGGIKPSSSPIPRRRSSVSSDDSQPPPSSSRKVSFADAFGLSLVSVKQFDAWAANAPSGPLERDLSEVKEYYMFLLCTLPQTVEELVLRTHEQKLELESLELLPGTTTLRGIIRVLNLCFDKMVYVRTSLDSWRSHFDLLAEYVPGSSNGETDCFSFKLTLVPPFGEDGSRVDFCLRYETSLGTFWANNNEKNYAFFFYEKAKEKPCEPCNSENKRKGCLKTTSSNVTALADATTNNEEFPDINTNSGKPTNTPSQNANSEKIQKDSKELEEDMSRIRDRRNRRKAARLAKVKEQFAKREEEKKQGTKAKESELKEETNVQEHASMLVKTPWSPLSQQTTGGPLTCNQTSLSPAECLKFAEHSGDSIDAFSRQVQAQPEKDTIIHFETNLSRAHANSTLEGTCCDKFIACSASEVLDDIQNIENLCDQTVSINQHVPGCQNSDLAISKNFKRAWENFEQDFRSLAQSSKIDEDSNISDGKAEQRENLTLKTSNSENQLFSHGLTFGTIVAPLYHQVFKKMESERKDFIHRAFQVNPSFRELEDESQRAVMPPESYYAPMRHTAEICPEPVHNVTVDVCNESTAQNLINKVKPIKNPLFESNEGKLEKTDDSTSGIRECPIEITITETNLHPKATSKQPDFSLDTLALTELSLQVDSHHSPCLIPLIETDPYDAIHKTMDSGIHSLSEQAPPSPPTMILKPLLSLENQSFATKIEVLQNQENSTNTQTHTKWEDITLQTQMPNAINNNLPLNKSNQILEESHNPISENITFVVPQNQTDLNPSLTKTQPHITSTPNQSPEVTPSLNPISGKSVETPNFSATSTVHTKHSNSTSFSLPQSPEDPQMRQTSAIILDSSDEKLEPVCCEMKMNNEKLEKCSHLGFETEPYTESENSQKIMSNALESCQMNEKKQMLMDFSTLTPETDRSSITDDTNDFDGKHDDTSVIKVMDEIDNIRKGELCQVSEGLEVQKEHKIMQTEKQGQEEENYEDEEEEQEEDTEAEVKEEINNTEDEIKYIDDEEDMDMDKMGAEREQNHQINAVDQQSLETEFEEQKLVIKTSNFELLPPICIDLDENEGQQCTGESQGDGEFSEREDSHHKSGVETYEDMGAAWQASTQNSVTALSRGIQAKKNDWDLLEFIDKEDDLCCESKKLQHEQESTDDVNNMLVDMECEPKDSMNRDIEADVEDNASTESLIDDEMELYLHSLRNSQQSVFREGMMNGSYCKRPSVSRGRSMSLAMPAISESVDEDQLNSSLEDVTNIEDIMELERATLPLVDGNEHVIGRNVLWWKEFLSYDNMSRVIGYTFLLIVFLVTAFYYDFIACFALYLLTVYWLFCQGEGEPLKSSRRAEKGPQ